MQIDFHHGTTYVLSRWAGFSPEEARVIAYASQYVDDAVYSGRILFNNGAKYFRRASAHEMADGRNIDNDANLQSWAIFHFLPGNPPPSEQNLYDEKLICVADSSIAQAMVAECIKERQRPCALHRLGITMHVYADTWAHAGFAGLRSEVNKAQLLDESLSEEIESKLLEAVDLGHGTVLTHPDQPSLSEWSYQDWRDVVVSRSNPEVFMAASEGLFAALQRYRAGNPIAAVALLSDEQKAQLNYYFTNYTAADGNLRHAKWLEGLASDDFLLGTDEVVSYDAAGDNSWKAQALQSAEGWESLDTEYPFSESFLTSDWKYFHDALEAHAVYVMHELLPQHGICIG